MSITPLVWIAIAVVVGQGALVVALIMVVRTFGAYTSVVLQTHQQNMLIQQENLNVSDDLAHLRAQLFAERAGRYQPPQSEDCVA